MEKLKNKILEHPAYSEFSGSNEQFLSELTGTLRDILKDLNSRNSLDDDIFKKLSDTIEVSNAIFRSFSNHEGLELILRLKSISDLYKKNLNNNTNLVRIAEHVLKKLDKFNSTFYHEATSDEIPYPEFPAEIQTDEKDSGRDLQYKWITFERNGSLFIARFSILEIIETPLIQKEDNTEPPPFYEHRGKIISLTDLMRTPGSEFIPPVKLLIIDQGKYCYAADHTGREIHGTYDMISPNIEPLEIESRLLSGRVRIFGRRYLVLRHD